MPKIRKFSSRITTFKIKYPRVIDEYAYNHLSKQPEKIGTKDIVAFVNAPARDTLLSSKLQRFFAGDLTALGGGTQKGIYTDVSGLPTDFNSLSNMVKSVNNYVSNKGFSSLTDLLKSLSAKDDVLKEDVPLVDDKEVVDDVS